MCADRCIAVKQAVIAAVLFFVMNTAHAEIYRWVDKAGVVHYSDQAPSGVNAQKKAYNNVTTPFRQVPESAFPKVKSRRVPDPADDAVDGSQEPSEPSAAETEPKRKRGTADMTDAVKYNDSDKQTLRERKAKIIENSEKSTSKLSERKSEINTEYKKILEDYRTNRQTAD